MYDGITANWAAQRKKLKKGKKAANCTVGTILMQKHDVVQDVWQPEYRFIERDLVELFVIYGQQYPGESIPQLCSYITPHKIIGRGTI